MRIVRVSYLFKMHLPIRTIILEYLTNTSGSCESSVAVDIRYARDTQSALRYDNQFI